MNPFPQQTQLRIILAVIAWIVSVIAVVLFAATPTQAQDQNPASENAPAIRLTDINVASYPIVSVTIAGDNLETDLATLPLSASVDGFEQAITDRQTAVQGTQTALVLDASSGSIHLVGATGIPRYLEVANGVNELVASGVLTDQTDWLALITTGEGVGEFAVASNWSQDQQAVTAALEAYRPVGTTGNAALYSVVNFALDQFVLGAASQDRQSIPSISGDLARSIIVFSNGFDVVSSISEEAVIERADRLGVIIHTVLLGNQDVEQEEAMQRLAENTGGLSIARTTPSALQPIWQAMAVKPTREIVTFEVDARSGNSSPTQIQVTATLPNGVRLTDSIELTVDSLPVSANRNDQRNGEAISLRQLVGRLISGEQSIQIFPLLFDIPLLFGNRGQTVAIDRTTFFLLLTPIMLLLAAFLLRRRRRERQMTERRVRSVAYVHQTVEPPDEYEAYRRANEKYRSARSWGQNDVELQGNVHPAYGQNDYAYNLFTPSNIYAKNSSAIDGDETHETDTEPDLPAVPLDRSTSHDRVMDLLPDAYLFCVSGGTHLPQVLALHAERIERIGRQPLHCDLVIHDRRVSRVHATIYHRDGVFHIRDEGSSGGTMVNMHPVAPHSSAPLFDHYIVHLNTVIYRFKAIEHLKQLPTDYHLGGYDGDGRTINRHSVQDNTGNENIDNSTTNGSWFSWRRYLPAA
ncbi:FHA domain-containing protein [Chloroflexi bacterium TSY]|nr:FHA domain-containing protein [Chloroflexi bacterium TSY]